MALFPRTKFLIDQERDTRANSFEPKYKKGDKWNSKYPVGKLILVTVPTTSLGQYQYVIITSKGATDPGVQGAALETELDKWIDTGILEPYTKEWKMDVPDSMDGQMGDIYNPDNETEIDKWLASEGQDVPRRERDHTEQLQVLRDKAEALKAVVPWMSNLWLDLDDATLMPWEDREKIKAAINAAKEFRKQEKSWAHWEEDREPVVPDKPLQRKPVEQPAVVHEVVVPDEGQVRVLMESEDVLPDAVPETKEPEAETHSCLLNHRSMIGSTLNPSYIDLSQLHHL